MTNTTFKITFHDFDQRASWIFENDMLDRIDYNFRIEELTFKDEDDATAFSLRFNLYPVS